jgi:hypothetical protein
MLGIGVLGVLGFLAPSLAAYEPFGIALSIGLIASGSLGVYARIDIDVEVEIIALRMMSLLCLAWSAAVLDQVIVTRSTNIQGSLLIFAQSTILWALASGISKGLRKEAEEIQQFIFVLMPGDTTPDGGHDDA